MNDIVIQINNLQSMGTNLKTTVEQLQTEFNNKNSQIHGEKTKLLMQMSEAKNVLDRIQRAQNKISSQQNVCVDNSVLEQEKGEVIRKMEQVQIKINDLSVRLANCENVDKQLREMDDQMRYLKSRVKLSSIEKDIDALGLSTKPSTQTLSQNENLTNKKVLELNNAIVRRQGQRQELQNKFKDVSNQLKSEAMRTAREKLKKKVVEKQVLSAAVEDLKKYRKVLDDSIIAFHHKKMEQINQILAELWPKVYQGNDIECIMIK